MLDDWERERNENADLFAAHCINDLMRAILIANIETEIDRYCVASNWHTAQHPPQSGAGVRRAFLRFLPCTFCLSSVRL